MGVVLGVSMQSGALSQTSGQNSPPAGQEAGGELTNAILAEPAPAAEPLFKGSAPVLWTTAGATMAIFLIVIIMIMRMHARDAVKKRRRRPSGEFFQPAGKGAEITFDEEATDEVETADVGDLHDEHPAAQTSSHVDAVEDDSSTEEPHRRRGFAGLFGGKRHGHASSPENSADDQRHDDIREEQHSPRPLRAHPLAHERRMKSGTDANRDSDKSADGAQDDGRSQARRPFYEETSVDAAVEPSIAEDEAARARQQVEEEFRRIEQERRAAAEQNAEFERRKQTAAIEQQRRAAADRARDVEEQSGALYAQIEELRRDLADELDMRFAALAERLKHELAGAAPESQGAAENLNADISSALREFDERLSSISQQLDHQASRSASDEQVSAIANLVAQRIAEHRDSVDAAIAKMTSRIDVAEALSREAKAVRETPSALQRATAASAADLGAPSIQLSDIIRNALPPDAFEMRAILSNNRKADCLVRLPYPPGPIAIDAQFPVEAFYRLYEHGAKPNIRADNEFRRATLRHVADVAERLIAPGETANSAIMFVPSERIYSELHARFPDVVQDSYRAQVWIVSPTTLMATLHTMRAATRELSTAAAPAESSGAKDVAADLTALRNRVGAIEDSLAARQAPHGPTTPSGDESAIDEVGSSGAQENVGGSTESSRQAPRRNEPKDSSEGDLWEDDSASEKGASFPLR